MYHTIMETCLKICIDNVPKRKLWQQSKIPRDRKILMKKRDANSVKNYRQLVRLGIVKIGKLTKLEKYILLSFENKRNLKESLAVSAIKSNPKLFYACEKQCES